MRNRGSRDAEFPRAGEKLSSRGLSVSFATFVDCVGIVNGYDRDANNNRATTSSVYRLLLFQRTVEHVAARDRVSQRRFRNRPKARRFLSENRPAVTNRRQNFRVDPLINIPPIEMPGIFVCKSIVMPAKGAGEEEQERGRV